MDQSRYHHLRTQTTIAYSQSKLVHLSKGQCNKGAHVYSNFTWKSGFFLEHWNLQLEKKHFLPGRNHHLTFKKMGKNCGIFSNLERRKDAWPLLGRHLNFQAGQPWQQLLMTKFREEGEEDRGPWLVSQIYFHPTLQFWRRSKYSDISLLPPICTNELQCYIENSFSPLQGSLRSHRKGLCHKLDTGSKRLHPCEPARH